MAKKTVVEKPAVGATETQPPAPPAKKEKSEVRTEVKAAQKLCEQIMSMAETKGWHFLNEVQAVVEKFE